MINEEAVAFLSRYLDSEYYTDKCNEPHQIAIEALEKQIPKKPIYEDTGNIYGAFKRTCSNCGDVCMISKRAKPFEHYCRYCGQKLDWSDEE